jgi:hypothetical protein
MKFKRTLLPLLALLTASFSSQVAAEFTSFSLTVNQDGTFDTAYPNGDKPPTAIDLSWSLATLPSAVGIETGTAYSQDLNDCCLSGLDAPSAVITIEDCSGDVAADNGWTVTGSDPDQTLGNTGLDADLPGSGAFALRATVAADSVLSNCINWSYITAPVGDALAPPIPTGLTVTGTATDEVSLAFDAVCDNHDGSEAGSGVASYNIKLDSAVADTVVATACSTAALAEVRVGAADSESSSQSDNSWTMTFGGAGLGDATDHVLLRNTAVSGDVTVIAKVTSLSSAASFPKAGVDIRAGTAEGDIAFYMYYQGNGNFQMKGRSQPDTTNATVCTQSAGSLPVWIKLFRDQSAGTIDGYYSNDGGEWVLCGNATLNTTATVQAGVFVSSSTASTTMTATLDEVNIHALPTVAKDVTTTVGGTWTVNAVDSDSNASAYSTGIAGSPGVDPPDASTPITGVSLNMASVLNTAPGNSAFAEESDNWPITWAADGNQYTGFGDGKGFHNHATEAETRASIGVSRISGTASNYSAQDLWKSGKLVGGLNGKTQSLLGANGKLYLSWDYAAGSGNDGTGSREDAYDASTIWKSEDFGVSWTEVIRWNSADWGSTSPPDVDGFFAPAFLQFGQDYAGARDEYVYVYLMEHDNDIYEVQTPGGITLARVLLANIESGNKNHWEYLTSIDGNNVPTWSTTLADRAFIFQDAVDGNHVTQVSYNAPLKRYVMSTLQGDRDSPDYKIGIYDAPEPWGPWSQIVKQNAATFGPNLATGDAAIMWGFSNKWLSTDGRDFVMVGTLQGSDQWGTVEGTFSTGSGPPPTGECHNWNPGHYVKVSYGDPMQTDQNDYENGIVTNVNNYINDSTELKGIHVAAAWGAVNTTGTQYNWDFLDELHEIAIVNGKQLVVQVQYKNFSSAPKGLQVPADLIGSVYVMNQGFIGGIWEVPVMDRLIAFFKALHDRYGDSPNFELVTISESVPSFGGVGLPEGYSHSTFATQLERLYTEMGQYFTRINFAANLNQLGTSPTYIPGLTEHAYQVGIAMGGPDARETMGYLVFQGDNGAVRDYRGLMGGFWTVSRSVLSVTDGAGHTPAQVVDREQAHGTNWLPWITYMTEGGRTWADIISAIEADPAIADSCPENYTASGGCCP